MRKAFLDEIFETEIVKLPEEVRDAYRTARLRWTIYAKG